MRKTIRSIVGLVVLVASLSLASPAHAQEESISLLVSGDGRLVTRGVAADVPVTIVCEQGLFITNLRVDLSQRVAQGLLASGSGEVSGPACTGTEQTITVRVRALSGLAFKNGVAVAQASLTVCDEIFSFCDFARTSDEIWLRK
jgi:hypothetical protein